MTKYVYASNESLRQQIDDYLSLEHVIIPLNDKIPLQKNWQKTTFAEVDKRTFKGFQSFGFVIPEDILIIDVDNHGSNIGDESLVKLATDYNINLSKKNNFIVRTAGNGSHYYFKIKELPTNKLLNALPAYPGIEFKSKGRQVVIPGSTLTNGKAYKLVSGNLKDLPEFPSALLSNLVSTSQLIAEASGRKVPLSQMQFIDNETDITSFKRQLETQPFIGEGERNPTFYQLSCKAKNLGISPKKLLPILAEWQIDHIHPQLGIDELKTTILNAYNYSIEGVGTKSLTKIFGAIPKKPQEQSEQKTEDKIDELWTDKLIRNKQGQVSKGHFGIRNTEIYLENIPQFKNKLALNLFTMDTVWLEVPEWRKKVLEQTLKQEIENPEDADKFEKQPSITDDDIIAIRGMLNDIGYDPTSSQIHEACRAVALKNAFHPVKDYFASLPEWDGVERLSKFFHKYCATPDNFYFSEIGKKIFAAIVTRIYIPGAKFDYTPIFVGEQGKAKSQLIKAMAIRPSWFTDTLGDIENKDVILQMRSKLIIENAEMAMTGRKAVTIQKAFLSRSTDRARLPYERLPRDIPRQCIFIATTNEERFLHDETGNRRMWPIEINKIDLIGVRENIDLFYAEALHLYKKGEFLYLTDEVEILAKEYQKERYETDEWQEKIEKWLTNEKKDFVQSVEIWINCLGRLDIAMFDIKNQKRIANILRAIGWKAATKRVGVDHEVKRGFERPKN